MIARALLLIPLVTSLFGCTASTETASTSSSASVEPTPTQAAAPEWCPKDLTAKILGKNDVPGMTHSIVPGDPQVLVICGPSTRVVVTDTSQVQRIADAMNGFKSVPHGVVFDCDFQRLPVFGLFFNYANGDVLLVQVGRVCTTVSNGHRAAFMDGSLRTRIKDLLASGGAG